MSSSNIRDSFLEIDCWETHIENFTGNASNSLAVVAGDKGRIVQVSDDGAGAVRYTVDASVPNANNGGQVSGNAGTFNPFTMQDLSLFRVTSSSGTGNYDVVYQVYIC